MFTTWELTKAAHRTREMFMGRRLKVFTKGEGMYTGWGLKLFTEKVRWIVAAKTWEMFTAWVK
jgi:hypothetical protein